MNLDSRARGAVRALERATDDADVAAALDRVRRRQRRAIHLQLAVATAMVLVLLAGAVLLRPGGDRQATPAGVAPTSTRPKPGLTRVPTGPATPQVEVEKTYPIPPGPPFPRAARSAFPPLFDSAKMRDLRRRSTHPLAFPTRLPDRLRWEVSSTQAIKRLSDYHLRPVGSKSLEVEVVHSLPVDGRSTDPLNRPVEGLTMPNGLKVYVYQDMTSRGTEAYIISDREQFVVVYFHSNCERPGAPCLTKPERWALVAGLAIPDRGR
jgi:hypothetical protein